MPEFASPFAGLDVKEKMTTEEVIRAIRFAIAAEYEAVQVYQQIANGTDDERVKKVMLDVVKEEKVHAGEFLELLKMLAPDEEGYYEEGAGEVKKTTTEKVLGFCKAFLR
jgi:rubrerythrin